jgi:uncharacterized RDD family membrane protein YckC
MGENDGNAIPISSATVETTAGLLLTDSSRGNSMTVTCTERSVAYASFWRRMAALTIDLVIVYLASWSLAPLLIRTPKPIIALWLVANCYFWIANALGATVGKKIVGIRVVDEHGSRSGFVRSFKRSILPNWAAGIVYALSFPGVTPLVLLAVLVQLLDAFQYFRHADRQTLHDSMAGTWVVRS